MTAIDNKISKLQEQLKQAKLQRQRLEARKRAVSAKATRQQETRKKVLVGAVVMARVGRGEWPRDRFVSMMDSALTRADDRALFDLPTRVKEPEPAPHEQR